MKDVIILGGPNGAGKTSAASDLLPETLGIREFVNADNIARGLSPFNEEANAIAAGRLMITRIRTLARNGENFAFETTCSGVGHVRLLKTCRTLGYRITLIFLWLPTPEAAIARVARRVREGGHRIPEEVIVRRYHSGLRNMLTLYLPAADIALVYNNTDRVRTLIAELRPDSQFIVHDKSRWTRIEEASR